MTAPARPGYDRRIIDGSISQAVWRLAWPTALMNVFSGLQGLIDHALVGHFVGYRGNAAVGVSWQIFMVVIIFISSVFSGMTVLVARYAGAGDSAKVERVVYQAMLVAVVLAGFVFAPLGYLLAPALLRAVKATPAVQAEALPYLRIMLVFSFGKLLFFMLSGALRAVGDARTPMHLGLRLTLANLVLNLALIPWLGTTGAAVGTVVAAGSVTVICVIGLFRGTLPIHFRRGLSLRPDWLIIRQLFRFGLPTGFQGVAVNVAGVLLLRFVGGLPESAAAQAAFAVCYGQLFSLVSWTSVGLMHAAATVAGQNLGAGRPERTRQAPAAAARLGLVLAGVMGTFFVVWPHALLQAFGLADPTVQLLGRELLAFLAVSGFFVTTALSYTGGLNGTGATTSSMYIALISQIAVPLGICGLLTVVGKLESWHIWSAITCGHITRSILAYATFKRGRWADIIVDVGP